MSAGNTVRVQHGHQDKHKVFSKEIGPRILFVEEEGDDAIHGEAGGRFDGMHPSRDEDDGLIVPKLGDLLVAEGQALGHFEPLPALVGGDDQHIDNPLLVALGQLVPGQEKLPIPLIISLQFHQIFSALLVGIRIDEGEFHAGHQLVEQEIKPQN